MASFGTIPKGPPPVHVYLHPGPPPKKCNRALAFFGPIGWFILARDEYQNYRARQEIALQRKKELEAQALALSEARADALVYEHYP